MLSPIEESLIHFLESDNLQVAIIKGKWGIGKTFFWNSIFQDHKSDLAFRAYSYVSLFGIQDFSGLKNQIFANFEPLKSEDIQSNLLKWTQPFSKVLEDTQIPHLKSLGVINTFIENKFVENFLICFDDLERKEKNVSLSSILGLISYLKEQKNCKVVLIYNDNELDHEAQEQIDEYREKVVDLDLAYNPSIDENVRIVWKQDPPNSVCKLFKSLDINNIRIMQRVKWTLDYFSETICSKYVFLRNSFENKCILLTIIYYAYGKIIEIEELLSMNYYEILTSEENNEKTKLFKKLRYFQEEQDRIIVEYLKNGYVDIEIYKDLLEKKNRDYQANDIRYSHEKVWEKFNSQFNVSQEEFIDCQIDFLNKNAKNLGITGVDSVVRIISELDPSIDLTNYLNESIDLFVENLNSIDDLDSLRLSNISPDVVGRIKNKLSKKTPNYSIKDLFIMLAGSDSWHPRNFEYLLKFSEDDLYNWIIEESSLDIIALLNKFLERFGNNYNDDNAKIVVSRLKSALHKIEQHSRINELRVKYCIRNL